MSAREEILSAIHARRMQAEARPAAYHAPLSSSDAAAQFGKRAKSAAADVRRVASTAEIPQAVAAILRDRNLPAVIHLAGDAGLEALPWSTAPGLTIDRLPPGPDDAALARASYAIAETGTLAYPSAPERPASWHFRPGLEIAVLQAEAILPSLESVVASLKGAGALPHTLNFVTGPSRTGDIEQTLELGAHGPKALVVLIVDSAFGTDR
jgi:L-lactate dehydrogenase complex protein LldG